MKLILADKTEYTITNFAYDSEHVTFRLEYLRNFTNVYKTLTTDNLTGATFYDDDGEVMTSGNYVYQTCRPSLAGANQGVHVQIILGVYQEPKEAVLERELTQTQLALVELYETIIAMQGQTEV